jgi:hypothetical protein
MGLVVLVLWLQQLEAVQYKQGQWLGHGVDSTCCPYHLTQAGARPHGPARTHTLCTSVDAVPG